MAQPNQQQEQLNNNIFEDSFDVRKPQQEPEKVAEDKSEERNEEEAENYDGYIEELIQKSVANHPRSPVIEVTPASEGEAIRHFDSIS